MPRHTFLFLYLISRLVLGFTPERWIYSSSPVRLQSTSQPTDFCVTLPPFAGEEDGQYPSLLHNIHVKSLLSDEECSKCLSIATEYATTTGSWESPDFDRHVSYATCDFCVEECDSLDSYLQEIDFDGRLWEMLSECYDVDVEDMSYLDLFCAHYQAKPTGDETDRMDRLEAHRDGSLLSFTLLLNSPEEFEGGGTFFEALTGTEPMGPVEKGGIVRPSRAGDVVLQSGKVLHGADVVQSGKRTVLVGFVDVDLRRYRPGVLTDACRDWGRMDEAQRRLERQRERSQNGKGWLLNNKKWLHKVDGKIISTVQGYCPTFGSVERRAAEDYQRHKRLQAEDIFLRNILLSRDEVEDQVLPADLFGGDITVL